MSSDSTPILSAERRLFGLVSLLVILVILLNSTGGGVSVQRSTSSDENAAPLSNGPQSSEPEESPTVPASSSSSSTVATQQQQERVTLEPSASSPVGVYDGVPFFAPLPIESRGRSLSSVGSPTDINPDAPDPNLPPLTFAELRHQRFTVMARNIPAGLGLTTQLLTYTHLIAATQLLNRTLIFPVATRTTWFKLINMSATTLPGHHAPLSYVSDRETASRAVRTRSVSKHNFKWTREMTYGAPKYIKQQLVNLAQRTAHVAVVKLPSMFKLYPFGVEEKLNFGRYLCGIVFRSQIEEAAQQILGEMKAQVDREEDQKAAASGDKKTKLRFISVHLRIEPQDSVAFRRGAPTAKGLREWFRGVVGKVCEKYKTRNVFVASGPLGKDYEEAISSTSTNPILVWDGKPMRIFTKQKLFGSDAASSASLLQSDFFRESSTKVIWSGRHNIYPTNTRTAAVDLLVLTHGVASIVTAFSSLTPFVYSRQCFAGPQCFGRGSSSSSSSSKELVARGVYMYEVGSDGEMSNAKYFRCGYRMQELLRGGGLEDPPPKEDLFAENVRPNRMKLFDD